MRHRFLKVMGVVCILLCIVGVTFAGNFYADDSQLTLQDIYNETIFAASEKVDISGFVEGIGFAAAEDIRLTGNVEYAAFAGNHIRVDGSVTKEAFLAGNQIQLGTNSNIGRNAYIAAREVTISGNVEGSLYIAAEKVVFESAVISGDVSVGAMRLYVDETTTIEGTLTYEEDCRAEIANSGNIGEVKVIKINRVGPTQEEWREFNIVATIFSILTMIVTFLVLYLINPNFFNGCKQVANKSVGYFFLEILKGLAGLILIPIVCFVLMFTLVGLPIAFILLVFYLLLLFIAKVFFVVYLAELVVNKVEGMKNHNGMVILWSMIMIAVLKLVEMIPVVGGFVSGFSFLIGFGLVMDCIIYRVKKKEEIKNPEEQGPMVEMVKHEEKIKELEEGEKNNSQEKKENLEEKPEDKEK